MHLVCGFLGVGKTTFATALAARTSAVRLSVDELYLRLFADGPTYELDQAALDRLLAVLNDLWPQIVAAGTDVVLDFGFWRRALRDDVRARAAAEGANVTLHWLQCPDTVAVERCLARNGQRDAFLISREGYYELQRYFEAPADDEPYVSVDTSA